MDVFKNPGWTKESIYAKNSFEELEEEDFKSINERLDMLNNNKPEVSVCIIAWNEELSIVKTIHSLSKNFTPFSFEIVVVNNNSTDRTGLALEKLNVRSYFLNKQGIGLSRQLAQEKARGKFVLMADADCLYPKQWIVSIHKKLSKPNTSVAYSRHSFLGNKRVPRWKYFIYECAKNVIMEVRHINRPYLNAYGMCSGYVREYGIKEGFNPRNMRGSDGRMAFDLMKYGKIRAVRGSKSRVWTGDRRIIEDGSFRDGVLRRVYRELLRFNKYFTKEKPHDTHSSKNTEKSKEEYRKEIAKKLGVKR